MNSAVPTPLRIEFLDIGGLTLDAFRVDAGHAVTLLCVPGGPGFEAASLMPGILKLSKIFNLVLINPRGHGRSDDSESGDYSLPAYAREVLAVAKTIRLNGQRVGVLGHSFGGTIALEALATDTKAFEFSILVSAPHDASWRGGVTAAITHLGIAESTAAAEKQFEASPPSDQACKDLMVSYAKLYFPELPEMEAKRIMNTWDFTIAPYLQAADSIFPTLDLNSKLSAIESPSLIVAGESDGLIPATSQRKLSQLLKSSTYKEVPKVGHFPFLSRPDVFFSAVNDWWQGLTKGVSK